MKAMLESTSKIVHFSTGGKQIVQARVWEGVTEKGVKFHAFIIRVAADPLQDLLQFETELSETAAPSPEVDSIPLRMIL